MDEPVQIGPFELGDRLGEGGMGAVYRGEHRDTGVPVAIKVIRHEADADARRRFHREVQAHAALQHPGVVYLFDYGEIDHETAVASDDELHAGDPFVAMELADRGTVRDAMPVEDWETVCRLLVQILDALAYAHARGVVHRDLKPENFLVFGPDGLSGSDGRVKLADLGIAHAFQQERDADTTQLEGAAGTPLYMAPEQFRGQWRQYGPWTDLYAVGCIAWELVCGRPPITGDAFLSIAVKHEQNARPPLDSQFPVPDQLESWIHQAMAVDPERRFRRAADAARALPREILLDAAAQSDSRAGEETADDENTPEPGRVDGDDETQVPALASTAILGDREKMGFTETVADGEGKGRPAERGAPTAERILAEEHPPVPEERRPEQTEALPAPLVGAGLGLFGLRDPPFVDRRRECTRIWTALRDVVKERTLGLVLVEGEAGTGKSRLAEWTATRAHEVGAVRVLRATHTRAGGRNEGLRDALERSLRTHKMNRGELFEHLRQTLAPLEGTVEEWRERDAQALTEYLRPIDDGSREVDGPRYRFSSADQKRGLLVRILRRLAKRRPVLLWLDDLQWGDEALGVVDELFERRDEHPAVFVVATVRSDILRERPNFREKIEELADAESSIRLSPDPLEADDQCDLLQGLLPLEGEFARQLAERTEGHPLFAMQLLAHWIDEGVLEADPDGFCVPPDRQVELPADIHELWMDRIDRLVDRCPPGTRRATLGALERAAALGREIDGVEWRGLCRTLEGVDPGRLRNRLVKAGVAEDTDRGWAFAHGLLVDSLERRAEQEGRRRQHHRRCAELLEDLHPDRPKRTAGRRAEHWIEAGDLEEALEPLLQKASRLMEWGEREGYRRVLERRGELLEQLNVARLDPRSIENELKLASVDLALGVAPDSISTRLEELRRRAERTESTRLAAIAWRELSVCRQQMGRWNSAAEAAREASRWAEATGDITVLLHALLPWGWAAYYLGNLDESQEQFLAAHSHATDTGDDFKRLQSELGLGWVSMSRGDEERTSVLFEAALDDAREAGYRNLEAQCLNGLAELARFRGDAGEARKWYRRCGELKRELNNPYGVALSALNLAQVELMAARFHEAAEHLTDAERRLEDLSRRDRHTHVLRVSRLTHAAGVAHWSRFDELSSYYADGWSEDKRLVKDHPWLLEMAGDFAAEADEPERARTVWRLARDLWKQLGDEAAASDVAEKLDALNVE